MVDEDSKSRFQDNAGDKTQPIWKNIVGQVLNNNPKIDLTEDLRVNMLQQLHSKSYRSPWTHMRKYGEKTKKH